MGAEKVGNEKQEDDDARPPRSWDGSEKMVDQNDTHRGLPQSLGMPKMLSGKTFDGKILIGAYISDLMKWWQFLKVEFFD